MSRVLMGSSAMSLWALSRNVSPSLNWKESELLVKSTALRILITGEAVLSFQFPIMRLVLHCIRLVSHAQQP